MLLNCIFYRLPLILTNDQMVQLLFNTHSLFYVVRDISPHNIRGQKLELVLNKRCPFSIICRHVWHTEYIFAV